MRYFLSIMTFLILTPAVNATEWRGIVPLKSTRADVIRLLNQCSDQTEACTFKLGNEDVYILFASGLHDGFVCRTQLPAETVMMVHVIYTNGLKLRDLKVDKKAFEIYRYPKQDRVEYWDRTNGLDFEAYKDSVYQIAYLGAKNDGFCSTEFNRSRESFVHVDRVHYPMIEVNCPEGSVVEGRDIELSARSNVDTIRGYSWSVSAGRIVSGRLLNTVVVDTTGLAGQSVVVRVEHQDDNQHIVTCECTIKVLGQKP